MSRLARTAGLALAVVLLPAGAALAHSPLPGLSGFYAGMLHPLLAPAHLLVLLALGLLLSQRWREQAQGALVAFTLALALGLVGAAGLGVPGRAPPSLPVLLLALAALLGGVVAWGREELPWSLTVGLALISGLAIGLDSGPEANGPVVPAATLAGSGVGATLALLLLAGPLGESSWPPWLALGVRVLGSWTAASALLALALATVGGRLPG